MKRVSHFYKAAAVLVTAGIVCGFPAAYLRADISDSDEVVPESLSDDSASADAAITDDGTADEGKLKADGLLYLRYDITHNTKRF